ncbi:hypothetical protein A2Y83_03560 [Candidatus Falkowbacteria bacterium RBG_13_39_14]|uniref:N-acetyltransferase domain-containing protein n=1 Tax=Candidatus Falkowbacteria bacterium RBG_13_39_14 TaxID=1797985 RepID=A0A1F5S681_9BACT|nr:MAG: hypothetical protein A2Y83_03560 [Candidatus Falkowbacteria bacterium RBG_13_39_14]
MEKMKFEVLPKMKFEAQKFFGPNPPPCYPILFVGDRWSCITHVAIAKRAFTGAVAIATIAPKGESGSGDPAIVGIYVKKEFRGKGIGTWLLQKTVEYMEKQGLVPIRVDVLNSKVLRMIKNIPSEVSNKINIVDNTMEGMLDFIMES